MSAHNIRLEVMLTLEKNIDTFVEKFLITPEKIWQPTDFLPNSQSEKFIDAHGGRLADISVYGQESNPTTFKLAKMNLAIRGIDAKIELGDTFHNDKHKDLKADYIIANLLDLYAFLMEYCNLIFIHYME